jgi:hypothetical protein
MIIWIFEVMLANLAYTATVSGPMMMMIVIIILGLRKEMWRCWNINPSQQIQCMWNVIRKAIPVIIGTTGTTSKSFTKYMNDTPRKHEIKELQKTAILGTTHILRKVLMYTYKTLNMGNNGICTIHCNYRIATTLYTLETWFASGTQWWIIILCHTLSTASLHAFFSLKKSPKILLLFDNRW